MYNELNQLCHHPNLFPILLGYALLTGLCLGSFLNVVIWRVPQGLSVIKPRSFCPKCKHNITAWENIPLLSWLILRGKCRKCHLPISWRYPAIELLTGLLFAVSCFIVLRYHHSIAVMLRFSLLIFWGVAFSLIDIDTQKIPTKLLHVAFLTCLTLLFPQTCCVGNDLFHPIYQAFATPPSFLQVACLSLSGAVLASLTLIVINRLLKWLSPQTLNFGKGDIRYAFLLGFIMGINLVPFILLGTSLFAMAYALAQKQKSKPIPLAPFFSSSSLIILWIYAIF